MSPPHPPRPNIPPPETAGVRMPGIAPESTPGASNGHVIPQGEERPGRRRLRRAAPSPSRGEARLRVLTIRRALHRHTRARSRAHRHAQRDDPGLAPRRGAALRRRLLPRHRGDARGAHRRRRGAGTPHRLRVRLASGGRAGRRVRGALRGFAPRARQRRRGTRAPHRTADDRALVAARRAHELLGSARIAVREMRAERRASREAFEKRVIQLIEWPGTLNGLVDGSRNSMPPVQE